MLVLATTLPVLRDASQVLMEGFPQHLDYTVIANHLRALDGVLTVHSLHVWSLTLNKNALNVHLAVGKTLSNCYNCAKHMKRKRILLPKE
jgi:Co/Zn/Cd efflux system component